MVVFVPYEKDNLNFTTVTSYKSRKVPNEFVSKFPWVDLINTSAHLSPLVLSLLNWGTSLRLPWELRENYR